ncbi:MAG: sigma-70 family RNA polymerase sigma factor [Clostridia bacterium]|nr:sigma-70 family RNA polymerase sigma factor [Clostridia bacterium]
MDHEHELVLRAKEGDVSAFETLIEEYQKRIFAIAYRMILNPDDAADLTQEVIVKIFKNLDKFQGNSKFSTWVYRIATNTCLDELKKTKNKNTYSLDKEIETEEGSLIGELPDKGPTPEQAAEKKAVQNAVRIAIGRLNPEHKKVIVLRDLQGLSYEEIAEIVDCSVGTVKSRISRARENLKKILSEDRELFSDYFV